MLKLRELFQNFAGQKIALYGLGTETEKALEELAGEFRIAGLLDSFKESGELYGKPILSLQQVIDMQVSQIIVVARPGSCKAIAKRMKETCLRHKIGLFDIRGKNLLVSNRVTYDFRHLNGVTREELIGEAMRSDVVSFDLFDTLVTRMTLSYTDIFELMEYRVKEKGWRIPDFAKRRLYAEKELAKSGAPTLEEIYKKILEELEEAPYGGAPHGDAPDTLAKELAEMEWDVDFSAMVPREDVCGVLNDIAQSGKQVYIVTDTYYRKEQLIKALQRCCVKGYADIIASCEYHTGKQQELFLRFRERCGGGRFLHIGDDPAADLEAAAGYGIKTIRLYSGADLLDELGNLGLDSCGESLADRIRIGSFAAKLFNSPFQFEGKDRTVEIGKAHDIGYLLCAPMICDFLLWFCDTVKQRGIQNIWFSARDGYLIQKLYQMMEAYDAGDFRAGMEDHDAGNFGAGMEDRDAGNIEAGMEDRDAGNFSAGMEDHDAGIFRRAGAETRKAVYFLTSRIAAIRAGMEGISDVSYVDSMKFSGTAEENLKVRFGLDAKEIEGTCGRESGLLGYAEEIVESAKKKRDRYRKYIAALNPQEGEAAFFDFVAKGTTQLYVQKITGRCLLGLYFLRLEPEFMSDKGLEIESFYKVSDRDNSAIFDDYYILETVLTAPHPMVIEFDDGGRPVYAKETRSGRDIQCAMEVQEGILDYFRDYLRLIPEEMRKVNRELDEKILRLVHEIKIPDQRFRALTVEDPFFNRMTEIEDVL